MTESEQIKNLQQELTQLRAVVRVYDQLINDLPPNELIRFANAMPDKFRTEVSK